jgi:hypothetical protein
MESSVTESVRMRAKRISSMGWIDRSNSFPLGMDKMSCILVIARDDETRKMIDEKTEERRVEREIGFYTSQGSA